MSSLVSAAERGDYTEVKRHLDNGVNVNEVNSAGDAAIHWAAWTGNTRIIELLAQHGANLNQKGGSGKTPIELARHNNQLSAAALLEQLHGASPSSPQPEKWEKMGASTVAHVGYYPHLGMKLTSVFNFESRDRTIISESLKSGQQSVGASMPFDQLAPEAVENAYDQFTKLGGKADRNFVMSGAASIGKAKLGQPKP